VGWGFGALALLAFVNMIFLLTSRNARLKRSVSLVGIVVIAILMVVPWFFMGLGAFGLSTLPFLVVVVAFNCRKVRFCDACGFTNLVPNPFKSGPLCDDCGKPLDAKRKWL